MIAPANPTHRQARRSEPHDLVERLRFAELEIQRLDRLIEWLIARECKPRLAVLATPEETAELLRQHGD